MVIIREYSQIEIAVKQIDTACRIFITGEDFFSALTLAGAGEEILGKVLSVQGRQNSVENFAAAFALIKEIQTSHRPDQTESIKALNKARNHAKHIDQSGSMSVQMDPEFEAENMLHRAINNFAMLTGNFTDDMLAFLNGRHKGKRA